MAGTPSIDPGEGPARVLLVGEGLGPRRRLELLLVGAGHRVASVATADLIATAASILRAEVVILRGAGDSSVGVEVGRQLHGLWGRQIVPHLMWLSSGAGTHLRIEALDAGVDEYVPHPVSDREMLARVAAAVRRHRASHAVRLRRALMGILEDLRHAERTAREHAALLDQVRAAIVAHDLDQRVTYWSASAERLYGWSADDIVGRSIMTIYGSDNTRCGTALHHVLRSDEWIGELRSVTRSGAPLVVDSHWTLVRDSAGQPASVVTINTDAARRSAGAS